MLRNQGIGGLPENPNYILPNSVPLGRRPVQGRIIQDETTRFHYHEGQAVARQLRPLEALEDMPPGQGFAPARNSTAC